MTIPGDFYQRKTIRVNVLSILDAFSRYILADIIAPAENIEPALRVFRLAASKWGMGMRIRVCACAFSSTALQLTTRRSSAPALLCWARIRNWLKFRNPQVQGNIEAYHRSLKGWFVNEIAKHEVVVLQHVEALLQGTIELVYNRHKHRQIKISPAQAQALAQRI